MATAHKVIPTTRTAAFPRWSITLTAMRRCSPRLEGEGDASDGLVECERAVHFTPLRYRAPHRLVRPLLQVSVL